MPLEVTCRISIDLVPVLEGSETKPSSQALELVDGGAAPHWIVKSDDEAYKGFIPSSRENALLEGLVLFWATYLASGLEGPLDLDCMSATKVLKLGERRISESEITSTLETLAPFQVNVVIRDDSYVMPRLPEGLGTPFELKLSSL